MMTLFSGSLPAFQSRTAVKTAAAASTLSDRDIADAKAKGLVWVNTNTKIYHRGGQFYGRTKQGRFMTEADAQKAGYREAKPSALARKTAGSSKK
jgi:hypothetical protein